MSNRLPQNLNWGDADERWAALIDPVLDNPSVQNLILKNISLTTGANVINHKLGRKLTGWRVIRLRANVSIYDTQDTNQMPQLTLNLVASGPVVVDLEVL